MKKRFPLILYSFCIFTFEFVSAQIPSYVPTNGLVAWYPFNGNANDESGNGNNGIPTGVSLTSDRYLNSNSAYFFNGVNSWPQPADPVQEIAINTPFISLVNDYSISIWMSSSNVNKYQQCLLNAIPHTGFVVELNNENVPGKMTYGVGPANAFWDLIYATGAKSNYTSNTWYHVVFIKRGTTYSLFINGLFDGSSIVANSVNYSMSVGLRIGSIGGGYEVFKGALDDIAIYNRALSQEEITALYSGIAPCQPTTSITNLTVPSTELPYSWNGLTFNSSGSQTAHLTNACGADSAATLNLTVTNILPSYLPSNGLVAWYPFNGNANDESGNGNNLNVFGPTLTSDRFNNNNSCYYFAGRPELAQYLVTNSLQPFKTQEYSMNFWFTTNQYYTGHVGGNPYNYNDFKVQGIYQINAPNWSIAPTRWLYLDYNNSIICTGHNDLENNTGSGFCSLDSQIKLNRWYNAIIVYSNMNLKLYINGNLIGSTTIGNSYFNQVDMTFGGIRNGSSGDVMGGFNGKIDDIAIYNRALSEQEIIALYTNCPSPITSEFSATSCEQYVLPWGDSVTASGDYLHTYANPGSCDSIVTAHVTINHAVAGASENVSGTSSYALPWGTTAVQSGYYTHLYQNINGCDSLVTYYVVINKPSSADNKYVGVNVENPQRALHVKDVIRLDPRNAPPEDPTKGDMYFDGITNKLRIYDGSVWRDAY